MHIGTLTTLGAALLFAGCSNIGLQEFDTGISAAEKVGAILEIDPEAGLEFGRVETEGKSAIETLSMINSGDEQLAVIDVYLDAFTSTAFSLGELPLPIRLQGGSLFDVDVKFAPYAEGDFSGTLMIEVDDNGELTEYSRDLTGLGCDPSDCGT